tara:strand:- start:503 stop:952 length:450 start_codon:yes stop_codon:yes gene_type:complete
MYKIAPFELQYVERYTDLIEQFSEESQFGVYERQSVRKLVEAGCTQDNSASLHLLKDDRPIGIILGFIQPHYFDQTYLGLVELTWYVDPKERSGIWSIKLFKEFEALGEEKGVAYILTSLRNNSTPEKLERFYKKRGYASEELTFIKRL